MLLNDIGTLSSVTVFCLGDSETVSEADRLHATLRDHSRFPNGTERIQQQRVGPAFF